MSQRNGKIKTCVVPDTSAATLQNLMIENVAPEAIVITDAYQSYKGLEKHFNKHISIKHTEDCYKTVGYDHINNIEGFWSQFKLGVIGIYHYVSPQHLTASALNLKRDTKDALKAMLSNLLNLQKAATKNESNIKNLLQLAPNLEK
jgi:transposase-like protein